MKILSSLIAAFFVLSTLLVTDAEAKRFGGGRSLGKQYSMPRSIPSRSPSYGKPSPSSRAPAAAAAPQKKGGIGRWLGPLAGLAAGGLLASLFFGDAFEGFQAMDFLLIAALVIGGFFLFRTMRRKRSPAPASAVSYPVSTPPTEEGVYGAPTSPPPSAGAEEIPDWFDGPAFLEGAKTHFIQLQAAWDQGDFRDIREYTTPQLFAELQQEYQRLDSANQFTEVVRLDAQVLEIQRDGDLVVVSVDFSGLIREEERGTANRFHEIWHVQHPWDTSQGDWLIAGIQQVED